jgi:hypothetical protein
MVDISEEEQKKILLQYLKKYNIWISDEEEVKFNRVFKKEVKSCIVYGDNEILLRKAGSYLLLCNGRQSYLSSTTNELLDKMLSREAVLSEDELTYNELRYCKVLFLYHPLKYRKNKILFETINNIIVERKLEGRVTIILAEVKMTLVENTNELKVINLSSNMPKDDYELYNQNPAGAVPKKEEWVPKDEWIRRQKEKEEQERIQKKQSNSIANNHTKGLGDGIPYTPD